MHDRPLSPALAGLMRCLWPWGSAESPGAPAGGPRGTAVWQAACQPLTMPCPMDPSSLLGRVVASLRCPREPGGRLCVPALQCRGPLPPKGGLRGTQGCGERDGNVCPSSLPYRLRPSSLVYEDIVCLLPALPSHLCSRPLQLGRRLLLLHVHLPSLGNLRQKACPSLMLSLSNCLWLSLAEGNLQAVLSEGCCKNQWQCLLNSLHEGYLAITQGSLLKAQTSDLQWAGIRELQKEMH